MLQSDKRLSAQSFLQAFNLAFDWIINLDYRSRCVLRLSSIEKLAYSYYAPLTAIIGVFLCFVAMKVYHVGVLHKPISSYWQWRLIAALMWAALWSYVMIAKTSFHLINCVSIGKNVVLAAAPSVECYSKEHMPFLIGGALTFYVLLCLCSSVVFEITFLSLSLIFLGDSVVCNYLLCGGFTVAVLRFTLVCTQATAFRSKVSAMQRTIPRIYPKFVVLRNRPDIAKAIANVDGCFLIYTRSGTLPRFVHIFLWCLLDSICHSAIP
jgi:hypothetical protein